MDFEYTAEQEAFRSRRPADPRRTNADPPRHQGISGFLVDMATPGITVRPLVLMTGHRHFNEVFFTDVVVR